MGMPILMTVACLMGAAVFARVYVTLGAQWPILPAVLLAGGALVLLSDMLNMPWWLFWPLLAALVIGLPRWLQLMRKQRARP